MDFNTLLTPLSSDPNTGVYLKGDRSTYRSIRNAFNLAQSSFRQLIETPDSSEDQALLQSNQDNWQSLNTICFEVLTNTSKDIEIYAWWVMSLAFGNNALQNTASALNLLPDFIEGFWPHVQPLLPIEKLKSTTEQEQLSERAEFQFKPLIQLLGETENSGLLYMPLQMFSLVGDIDHGQYLMATKKGELTKLKEHANAQFAHNETAITENIEALSEALAGIEKLETLFIKLAAECNQVLPTSRFLKQNLQDCLNAIEYLVKDNFKVWPLDKSEAVSTQDSGFSFDNVEPATTEPVESDNVQVTVASAPVQQITQVQTNHAPQVTNVATVSVSADTLVQNREQAFTQIKALAEFFKAAEPHSPVSFLLEKAIRWGQMELPDLMTELMAGNQSILDNVFTLTGMDQQPVDVKQTESITQVVNTDTNNAETSSENEQNNQSSGSDFNW